MVNEEVDCIIVAAGMEAALATLVSSLVDIPVIGLPTSIGYGYGEKGIAALASMLQIAALASMLQSCSLGLSVVNIDGGIAAGAIAANIANRTVWKNLKK
jgi:NCAIR mutase (PurE)-related protein